MREIYELLKETYQKWRQANIRRLAAALAYYAAFSFVPVLLISALVVSFVVGPDAAEDQIQQAIPQVVGEEAAQDIQTAISNLNASQLPNTLTTIFSIGTLLFASTGFFRMLKTSLNTIWGIPPDSPDGIQGFIKSMAHRTALSFLLVMLLGALLLAVILLNTVLFQFVGALGRLLPDIPFLSLWQIAGFLLLVSLTAVVFAVIYRLLPDAEVVWSDVWMGALVTAIIFSVGQLVIGFMLSRSSMDSFYGAASTLMFVLIWVHISAHIILFGAQFTQVYANRYGAAIRPNNGKQASQKTGETNPAASEAG